MGARPARGCWPLTRAWPSGRDCTPPRASAWRAWSGWPMRASWPGGARPPRAAGGGAPPGRRARLGARGGLGVDIAPLAVEATAANARRNRVARIVRARAGSLPATGRPYDLVLANLIASLLVRLAAELYGAARPGSGMGGS